jgi:hypothetical protein
VSARRYMAWEREAKRKSSYIDGEASLEQNTVMDYSVESFSLNRLRNCNACRPIRQVIYFSSKPGHQRACE